MITFCTGRQTTTKRNSRPEICRSRHRNKISISKEKPSWASRTQLRHHHNQRIRAQKISTSLHPHIPGSVRPQAALPVSRPALHEKSVQHARRPPVRAFMPDPQAPSVLRPGIRAKPAADPKEKPWARMAKASARAARAPLNLPRQN